VSKPEREGLVARIRQIRRAEASSDERTARSAVDSEQAGLSALEARILNLEQFVEGLQDMVHRETSRQSSRISALEARVEQAAVTKALSDDAHERRRQPDVTADQMPTDRRN
jgi:hypothetical protein